MVKSRSRRNHNPPPSTKAVQTELLNSRGQQQTSSYKYALKDVHSRVPLGDCSSQHLNLRIGDMENDSVNGVTAQFQVQSMINHLQKLGYCVNKAGEESDVAENSIKNNVHTNGTKGISTSLEDLTLLDANDYGIDDNETEWLTKVPGAKKMSAKDLESDESFIDSGLLNFRFGLLNLVKTAIMEEKSASISNSPRSNVVTKLSQYEKRTSPHQHHSSSFVPPTTTHYTSPVHNKLNFENYPNRGYATMTLRAEHESSPPLESSPPPHNSGNNSRRSPFEFLSPSYQPPIDRLNSRDSNSYFSTPGKGPIDSRTYTRPKRSRAPLDTYEHLDLPVSPIKVAQNDIQVYPMESEILNQTTNMNETFVQGEYEEQQPERIQSEQPSRRVTRNLSYVIRRDSESPNNNSPVNVPSERDNYDTAPVEHHHNNTFVRSSREDTHRSYREDTYSPSPTGSSSSIHNTSSMEELHMLARQQEQSLSRMTSNPRMLTRKETHTVVRVPVNDPPVQPIIHRGAGVDLGQQKLRIQSRIPAPGLGSQIPGVGSRIRAPLNNGATRRPIASGGIRRATDWRDGGAY